MNSMLADRFRLALPTFYLRWFHVSGAISGDNDHRHLNRIIVAGGPSGPRSG